VQNPKTNNWVLIDKDRGILIKHSKTKKPYKNIKIVRRVCKEE
jgi:hypothetical protein